MKRFIAIVTAILVLCTSAAMGEAFQQASGAILDVLMADGMPENTAFDEHDTWISASAEYKDRDFTRFLGVIYDTETEAFVSWADIFAAGDAAAARMEAIAEEAHYANAYSEYNAISPVPRDNFALLGQELVIFYPPEQLSYFSGRAGAVSFYAYELEGLLNEGIPFKAADIADAKQVLAEVQETGTLPQLVDLIAIGSDMAQADASLTLVDAPDVRYDYAIWQFEAPQMRGAALLSATDDTDKQAAKITGIQTERIDFGGLCTGIATKADCIAALGEPATQDTIETADAYNRLPAGETLTWPGETYAVDLHFVDDVLQSVTVRAI